VTVFSKWPREVARRDRDLGQTFVMPAGAGGRVGHLYLRVGLKDLAVRPDTGGAEVAIQWFAVQGMPRLNEQGTPGFMGKFDRKSAPELDDFLEGEQYAPLHVVKGKLPVVIQPGWYLDFHFTGEDALKLEAGKGYGFLLMFTQAAGDRGLTLDNQFYGKYVPLVDAPLVGHGLRREGEPSFPKDWNQRLALMPGTLGFPDVCTYRDLYFAVQLVPEKE
jgi:hypothetical protein